MKLEEGCYQVRICLLPARFEELERAAYRAGYGEDLSTYLQGCLRLAELLWGVMARAKGEK